MIYLTINHFAIFYYQKTPIITVIISKKHSYINIKRMIYSPPISLAGKIRKFVAKSYLIVLTLSFCFIIFKLSIPLTFKDMKQ